MINNGFTFRQSNTSSIASPHNKLNSTKSISQSLRNTDEHERLQSGGLALGIDPYSQERAEEGKDFIEDSTSNNVGEEDKESSRSSAIHYEY